MTEPKPCPVCNTEVSVYSNTLVKNPYHEIVHVCGRAGVHMKIKAIGETANGVIFRWNAFVGRLGK